MLNINWGRFFLRYVVDLVLAILFVAVGLAYIWNWGLGYPFPALLPNLRETHGFVSESFFGAGITLLTFSLFGWIRDARSEGNRRSEASSSNLSQELRFSLAKVVIILIVLVSSIVFFNTVTTLAVGTILPWSAPSIATDFGRSGDGGNEARRVGGGDSPAADLVATPLPQHEQETHADEQTVDSRLPLFRILEGFAVLSIAGFGVGWFVGAAHGRRDRFEHYDQQITQISNQLYSQTNATKSKTAPAISDPILTEINTTLGLILRWFNSTLSKPLALQTILVIAIVLLLPWPLDTLVLLAVADLVFVVVLTAFDALGFTGLKSRFLRFLPLYIFVYFFTLLTSLFNWLREFIAPILTFVIREGLFRSIYPELFDISGLQLSLIIFVLIVVSSLINTSMTVRAIRKNGLLNQMNVGP